MPLFFMINSSTCFVVQPCLELHSSFFMIKLVSSDNLGDLPILVLSFSPRMPSLSYLFSQSEAQGLLLCISFTTRKGICLSSLTLIINSNLSLTFGSFSFLYKLTNLDLVNDDIENI